MRRIPRCVEDRDTTMPGCVEDRDGLNTIDSASLSLSPKIYEAKYGIFMLQLIDLRDKAFCGTDGGTTSLNAGLSRKMRDTWQLCVMLL